MQLTLCLLTLNELDGCRHDVPKLDLAAFDEVYAIDGDSNDGTVEYLEDRGIIVHQQTIRGYNGAYIAAFEHCTTDAVIFFHPKGSIEPAATLKFRSFFEDGYDLVIGSRIGKTAHNEENSQLLKPRKWFVIMTAFLMRCAWQRNGPDYVWDVLHGFRAMRKDSFARINLLETGLSGDLEMVARSYKNGFRIAEFPVVEKQRLTGSTHFSAWPTGKKLLRYLWFEVGRNT